MRRTASRNLSQQQFVRAYLVRAEEDELKIIRLARFGAYEVRLIELSVELHGDVASTWVELYAHDIATSLDSFCCEELDEAVDEANALIAQARDMHQLSRKR